MPYHCNVCQKIHPTGFVCKKPKVYRIIKRGKERKIK